MSFGFLNPTLKQRFEKHNGSDAFDTRRSTIPPGHLSCILRLFLSRALDETRIISGLIIQEWLRPGHRQDLVFRIWPGDDLLTHVKVLLKAVTSNAAKQVESS